MTCIGPAVYLRARSKDVAPWGWRVDRVDLHKVGPELSCVAPATPRLARIRTTTRPESTLTRNLWSLSLARLSEAGRFKASDGSRSPYSCDSCPPSLQVQPRVRIVSLSGSVTAHFQVNSHVLTVLFPAKPFRTISWVLGIN